jgi:hypothetical protein
MDRQQGNKATMQRETAVNIGTLTVKKRLTVDETSQAEQ